MDGDFIEFEMNPSESQRSFKDSEESIDIAIKYQEIPKYRKNPIRIL